MVDDIKIKTKGIHEWISWVPSFSVMQQEQNLTTVFSVLVLNSSGEID